MSTRVSIKHRWNEERTGTACGVPTYSKGVGVWRHQILDEINLRHQIACQKCWKRELKQFRKKY